MKIIQFIHGLNTGGAETLVKEYALNLNKKKYDVIVLCLEHYKDSPYEKLLNDNGIKVIYICDYMKFHKKKSFLFKCFNYIQRYLLVRKVIHNENPDIMHTHLTMNKYVKFAKPKKKVKIFNTVHSKPKSLWPNSRNKDYKAAKWLVKKYNMRFICLHDEMRNEVNSLFNVSNTVVIKNGIDFFRFDKKINSNQIRENIGIDKQAFIVGHIGRFSKEKNHEFLIDIFNEIYKKNKNAFLLMVGLGKEENYIINKLHLLNLDNRYLILKNRADIPELLSVMDIFVLPSIFEGLPISLIEAQKMNLPCFISNKINDEAIISNLVTKLSLNITAKEWANAILNYKIPTPIILNDEEWSMAKVIDKLEQVYLGKV